MTPKKFKTSSVSRERYGTYLKKAREFLRSSEAALDRGDWDAVGLNAVHSAISAADALLVYYGGVRSTGDSHHDVAGLLTLHVKDEQIGAKTQTLAKILTYKHVAAYEDREVTATEARDASKLARRFMDWAESRLTKG
jgi:HEPN domain-containing protein